MMWDEVGLTTDMSDENDGHSSNVVIAPVGHRPQIDAPKTNFKMTFIAPLDGDGAALPPIGIVQSDDTSSIFSRSDIQLGVNYFHSEVQKRYPGMPKVTTPAPPAHVTCPAHA